MIWSLIKSFLLAIVGLPVTLIGLPLVAIGLPFRRSYPETMRPFSQYPEHGQWMLIDTDSVRRRRAWARMETCETYIPRWHRFLPWFVNKNNYILLSFMVFVKC
jgi:hypothetical protein